MSTETTVDDFGFKLKAFEEAALAFQGAAWIHDQPPATSLAAKEMVEKVTPITPADIDEIMADISMRATAAGVPAEKIEALRQQLMGFVNSPRSALADLSLQARDMLESLVKERTDDMAMNDTPRSSMEWWWNDIHEKEKKVNEAIEAAYLRGDISYDEYKQSLKLQEEADALPINDPNKLTKTAEANSYDKGLLDCAQEKAETEGRHEHAEQYQGSAKIAEEVRQQVIADKMNEFKNSQWDIVVDNKAIREEVELSPTRSEPNLANSPARPNPQALSAEPQKPVDAPATADVSEADLCKLSPTPHKPVSSPDTGRGRL